MKRKWVINTVFVVYATYAMIACQNTTKSQTNDTDSVNVSNTMSVDEAKNRIYYKSSELHLSQTVVLNQDNNHGAIYSATVDFLKKNSILRTVIKYISKDSSAQDGGVSLLWNNTSIFF